MRRLCMLLAMRRPRCLRVTCFLMLLRPRRFRMALFWARRFRGMRLPLLDALQHAALQRDASRARLLHASPPLAVLQHAALRHDASRSRDVLQRAKPRLDASRSRRSSAREASARCVSLARRSSARAVSARCVSLARRSSARDASARCVSRRSTFFSTRRFSTMRLCQLDVLRRAAVPSVVRLTRSQCSGRLMRLASARLLLESPLFGAVSRYAALTPALLFGARLRGGSLMPVHPIGMIRGDPFRIFSSPIGGRVPDMVAVEVAMPIWMISLNPRRLILPPPRRRVPLIW